MQPKPTIIIWDLGNVLFAPSKFRLASYIGFLNCILYIILEWKNPAKLRTKFFDILNATRAQEPRYPYMPADELGTPMPNIMADYQAGIITSQQLLQEVFHTIQKRDRHNYFSSKRERLILEKTMQAIFDPTIFVYINKPIIQAIDLLAQCHQNMLTKTWSIQAMMILSNLEAETFELMQQSTEDQSILQYFEPHNIFISGFFHNRKMLKPSPEIFSYLLAQRDLNPESYIFIDDQDVNIKTARACGMHAIHLQNGDYQQVEMELKRLLSE